MKILLSLLALWLLWTALRLKHLRVGFVLLLLLGWWWLTACSIPVRHPLP